MLEPDRLNITIVGDALFAKAGVIDNARSSVAADDAMRTLDMLVPLRLGLGTAKSVGAPADPLNGTFPVVYHRIYLRENKVNPSGSAVKFRKTIVARAA